LSFFVCRENLSCAEVAKGATILPKDIAGLFAEEFGTLLLQLIRKGESAVVAGLSRRRLPVPPELFDRCYAAAYGAIRDATEALEHKLLPRIREGVEASQLIRVLRACLRVPVLNALPDYFRDARSGLAKTVSNAGRECYNGLDNTLLAHELYKLARTFETDQETARRLEQGVATLAERRRAEEDAAEAPFVIHSEFDGRQLRIDKGGISYGEVVIPLDSLAGLRWGRESRYSPRGDMVARSCLVAVRGARGEVVELECEGWGTNERSMYELVVASCKRYFVGPLVEAIVRRLVADKVVSVASAMLRRDGIRFEGGESFLWRDVQVHESGEFVTIMRRSNPSRAESLRTRSPWNVVLLDAIVRRIQGAGKE
jgi:hypothetical protein